MKKTKSGLFLPPGVQQKEKLYSGYVIKVGPGYPIPSVQDYDEPWKDQSDDVKYVPLQPKRRDLAVYLQNSAWEIVFNDEKYLIVPGTAILMLVRDKDLMRG
jgi:chaperonin GroES